MINLNEKDVIKLYKQGYSIAYITKEAILYTKRKGLDLTRRDVKHWVEYTILQWWKDPK